MAWTGAIIERGTVRFDDKLATVLAQPRDDAAARAAAWRQIVDILAQMPPGAGDPLSGEATALLRTLRDGVAQHVRTEAVAALVGRRVHATVVGLVAEERPAVAALLMGQAQLEDGEWLFLLPRLSVPARALLRHRRDLSAVVRTGLASFGTSDFSLPDATAAGSTRPADSGDTPIVPAVGVPADKPSEPQAAATENFVGETRTPAMPRAKASRTSKAAVLPFPTRASGSLVVGDTPITDMLARIASYKRDDTPAAPPPPATAFRFETGADGVILWVEGAPRAALIGLGLATVAFPTTDGAAGYGVDGQAAGAFRQRAPFRDARLTIAGGGAGGEWRIAGVPVFDAHDGRFTGYRGTARRPRVDERAAPPPAGLYGTGLPADALRQLVHELRTPLNAIVGFGEMIERQVLGPAAAAYRDKAGAIVADGRRLLGVVDDLDAAARADVGALEAQAETVAPAALLRRLWRDYRPLAATRGAVLDLALPDGSAPLAADPALVERMVARLLAATLGVAGRGETIVCRLVPATDRIVLQLTRPAMLAGQAEAVLLDPGFTPDGDLPDALSLGLGFTLRLVRNLAATAGGTLKVDADHFVLSLPSAGVLHVDESMPG